jgi:hypothetical protein
MQTEEQQANKQATKVVTSPRQLIADITSGVTLVTGLLTAIGLLIDKLPTGLPHLTHELWWIVVLSLVTVTFVLQRRRLLVRSELRNPDVFSFSTSEHLVGRTDDIRKLSSKVSGNACTWLVGESGAGKSSLVRDGLLPIIRKDPTALGIYIDSWASGWEAGPKIALTDALVRELSLFNIDIGEAVTADNIVDILPLLKSKIRKTPVLLLDQFDDYQIANKLHFVPEQGKLLTFSEITAKSTFWRTMAECLRNGAIRCVFVTRSESVYGLESVRFIDPSVYPLERLGRKVAFQLLTSLVGTGAIDNPERGWNQLAEKICSDLEIDGSLLPVQMRIVFRSIANLKNLTVAAYQAQGGLLGLEASHISIHVNSAARLTGLSALNVRSILLSMVDPVSKKTIPVSQASIAQSLPERYRDDTSLRLLLEYLASNEVLRRRADFRQGTIEHWSLYHDYLSRGLLELQRRAHYWQAYLWDSLDSYSAARGFGKLRTLLGPVVQLRILYERLRGRLRYERSRTLAVLSSVRLIANIPALLLALVVVFTYYINSQSRVFSISTTIGSSGRGRLSPAEARALWRLEVQAHHIRRDVLLRITDNEGDATRFLARIDYLPQALTRFSGEESGRMIADLMPSCEQRYALRTPSVIASACATALIHLGIDSAQAQHLITDLSNKWKQGVEVPDLASVRDLFALLRPEQSFELLQDIAPSFKAKKTVFLADALKLFAIQLDQKQLLVETEESLAALEVNFDERNDYPLVLRLCELLDGKQAVRLLSVVERTTDMRSPLLSQAAWRAAARMTPELASLRLKQVIAGADRGTGTYEVPGLVRRLTDEDKAILLPQIMDHMLVSDVRCQYNYTLAAMYLAVKLPRTLVAHFIGCITQSAFMIPESDLDDAISRLVPYIRQLPQNTIDDAFREVALERPFGDDVPAPALFALASSSGLSAFVRGEYLFNIMLSHRRHRFSQKEADLLVRLLSSKDVTAFISLGVLDRHDTSDDPFNNMLIAKLTTAEINNLFMAILAGTQSKDDGSFHIESAELLAEFVDTATAEEAVKRLLPAWDAAQSSDNRAHSVDYTGTLAQLMSHVSYPTLKSVSEAALKVEESKVRYAATSDDSPGGIVDEAETQTIRPSIKLLIAAAQRLPLDDRNRHLQTIENVIVRWPNPPCEDLASLIDRSNAEEFIDIVKWPTCTESMRTILIEHVLQIEGIAFSPDAPAQTKALILSAWAKQKGFDVDSEPRVHGVP